MTALAHHDVLRQLFENENPEKRPAGLREPRRQQRLNTPISFGGTLRET